MSPIFNNTIVNESGISVNESEPIFFHLAAPYIYTFIGCLGLTTNIPVAVIIKITPVLNKRIENRLIVHQAVIDSIIGLLLMLNLTSDLIKDYTGFWGGFLCKFWVSSTPLWIALQISICNLLVITLERYLEIVHNHFYRRYHLRRFAWVMILAPWLFALLSSLPFILFKNKVIDGQCIYGSAWPSIIVTRISIILNFCEKYLIPLIVFIYCYTNMILTLRCNQIVLTRLSTGHLNV